MGVLRQIRLYLAIMATVTTFLIAVPPAWILLKWSGAFCMLCMITRRLTTEYNQRQGRIPVDPSDKAVFITGCDSGFGFELVRRLDILGYTVFAGCQFPEGDDAESLSQICSENVIIVGIDVTSDESVQLAFKKISKNLGPRKLWAVVGNAGVCYAGELEWGSLDWLQKTLDVNVVGLVRSVRPFLPLLRRSGGRVICTTSLWGHYAIPPAVPYCMSKHAARCFVDGLRREMKKFGVKCISIEPNVYKTELTESSALLGYMRRSWDQTPSSVRADYGDAYYQKATEWLKLFIKQGRSQVFEVIDDFEDAVTATCPKYAYHPDGWVRGLLWRLAYIAPPALQDYLVNSVGQPGAYVAFKRISK